MNPSAFRIVSFSSEGETNKASNLIQADPDAPWITQNPEKRAQIEIELNTPGTLVGLDIGNYGAAFLDVKVSSVEKGVDSFMNLTGTLNVRTMKEIKEGLNLDAETSLKQERFTRSILNLEISRVQITLIQPYPPTGRIGLSFLRVYTSDAVTTPPPNSSQKSNPTSPLKSASQPSQPLPLSSSSPQKSSKPQEKEQPDASITKPSRVLPSSFVTKAQKKPEFDDRSSSSSSVVEVKRESRSPQPESVEVKKEVTSTQKITSKPPESISSTQKITSKPPESISSTQKITSKPPESISSTQKITSKPPESISSTQKISSKPPSVTNGGARVPENTKDTKSTTRTPLDQILKGVVIVISGIQNPERGELRKLALDMGARYKGDWTQDSTHLICAFSGTSKQKDATSSGGFVVKKDWIVQCHKQGRRLDEKEYSFMNVAQPSNRQTAPTKRSPSPERISKGSRVVDASDFITDFDEDEDADFLAALEASKFTSGLSEGGSRKRSSPEVVHNDISDEESNAKKRALVDKPKETQRNQVVSNDDGDDDDDDGWLKTLGKNQKGNKKENTDAYADWTHNDEDTKPAAKDKPASETKTLTKVSIDEVRDLLPSFFDGCNVYFHRIAQDELRVLKRVVFGYGGEIADSIDPSVTHIVTQRNWEESYETATLDNPDLKVVRPAWVIDSAKEKKLKSTASYKVSPR